MYTYVFSINKMYVDIASEIGLTLQIWWFGTFYNRVKQK